MPKYDYYCPKCESHFVIEAGIKDPRDKVKCPKCKNKKVNRVFGSVGLVGLPTRGSK